MTKYDVMETLITPERALTLIQEAVKPLAPAQEKLEAAAGLVTAMDLVAPLSVPAFPQSNMDGYAFAYEAGVTEYEISAEVPAGDERHLVLAKGQAARIFTGAPVPEGADTVVMQEKVAVTGNHLTVLDSSLYTGMNVRAKGTEIRKGALALKQGSTLQPVTIGFLAGLGFDAIPVYPRPKIGLLITGNELQEPGKPLRHGQVYESGSFALRAALEKAGIRELQVLKAGDQLSSITEALTALLNENDLVLVTGGVSVGDYDFTFTAFQACGISPLFHKIRQKPGKPLLMGSKGRQIVMGLPGNPSSVLTCFYEYVLPVISRMMQKDISLKKGIVPLENGLTKPQGLTSFLKASYNGKTVSVVQGQESYKLSGFTASNCLIRIPEGISRLEAGEQVEIHLLPE